MNPPNWRLDAAGAADAGGVSLAPASLLVARRDGSPPWACELIAVGDPGQIDRHPASAGAARRALPRSVVTPAYVNAHAHLDLTHVGPRAYDAAGGFVAWAMMVRAARCGTVTAAVESIREGVARSLAGGVVAVGDIVGKAGNTPHPDTGDARIAGWLAVREMGMLGVSFAEVFGVGSWQDGAIEEVRALAARADRMGANGPAVGVRFGLQPHAPYSAGRRLYAAACAGATPVATHLAETPDERQFVERGNGAFRELLQSIGRWDGAAAGEVGLGAHPIEHVLDAAATSLDSATGLLAAHVNDCPDELIPRLKRERVSVAYCPRAHAYFGHPATTGPHKYREMLSAGVNVCLGTDSIINLPPGQSERLSVLDEMRLLHSRDGTDARTLLAMGTTHGASALGLDPRLFTLAPGELGGLVAVEVGDAPASVDPLRRVMTSRGTPLLLRWEVEAAPMRSGR